MDGFPPFAKMFKISDTGEKMNNEKKVAPTKDKSLERKMSMNDISDYVAKAKRIQCERAVPIAQEKRVHQVTAQRKLESEMREVNKEGNGVIVKYVGNSVRKNHSGPSSVATVSKVTNRIEPLPFYRQEVFSGDRRSLIGSKADDCGVCGSQAEGSVRLTSKTGVRICDRCHSFFLRSVKDGIQTTFYICRGRPERKYECNVTSRKHPNICRYCLLQKCFSVGLNGGGVYSSQNMNLAPEGTLTSANVGKQIISPQPGNTVIAKVCTKPDTGNGTGGSTATDPDFINRAILNGVRSTPILTLDSIQFSFLQPVEYLSETGLYTENYLNEAGSRLLKATIAWAKSQSAFKLLNRDLQLTLLRTSWTDLFVIGLIQNQKLLNIPSVIATHMTYGSPNREGALEYFATLFQLKNKLFQAMKDVIMLKVDDYEFAALKLLAMFNPMRVAGHGEVMCSICSEFQAMVLERLTARNMDDENPIRCHQLSLLLPQIQTIDSQALKFLFFSQMGQYNVDLTIPYLFDLNETQNDSDTGSSTGSSGNAQCHQNHRF